VRDEKVQDWNRPLVLPILLFIFGVIILFVFLVVIYRVNQGKPRVKRK
jgi:hypothetical protein